MSLMEQMRSGVEETSFKEAVRVAARAAATDTGAIENLYPVDRGFTMSVATQSAAWEAALGAQEPEAQELIRAQLRAYELVLDLGTENKAISEAIIRRIHEEICAPQEHYTVYVPDLGAQQRVLVKGRYKEEPNHVVLADGSIFSYAPVTDTPAEMHRLVSELKSAAFREAHPSHQAAFAHYALARVHPFPDGNGRVARALASIFLYRGASIPFLVLNDQKDEYLSALRSADKGDYGPALAFVVDRSAEAMELVAQTLETARFPRPEDSLTRIGSLFLAAKDLSHGDVDRIGHGVLETVHELIASYVTSLEKPPGLNISIDRSSGAVVELPGYRQPINPPSVRIAIQMTTSPPAAATSHVMLSFLVSTNVVDRPAYQITTDQGPAFPVKLEDAYPELRTSVRLRLAAWLEEHVRRCLARLLESASEALRASGYGE